MAKFVSVMRFGKRALINLSKVEAVCGLDDVVETVFTNEQEPFSCYLKDEKGIEHTKFLECIIEV